MSMEERLEKAEKLVAEVKAELAAMRAEKRNWPERIEAGDCFEDREDNRIWLAISERTFCCVIGENTGVNAYGHREAWVYLGRDILTIRTDAHEPTGAELVGKMCEFSDLPTGPWSPGLCAAFGHNPTYQYRKAGGAEWRYARLAK